MIAGSAARVLPIVLALVPGLVPPLAAQDPSEEGDAPFSAIYQIGGKAEDRLRLREIRGEGSGASFLIRSTSSLTRTVEGDSAASSWSLVAPTASFVVNSAIPLSMNDGALWAGRGLNFQASTGIRGRAGPFFMVLAPEFRYETNDSYSEFRKLGPTSVSLDPNKLDWRVGDSSIDLPYRFGRGSQGKIAPGQSVIGADAGRVTIGVSTEDQWWGPGVRNALILSNNAAGFPYLFIRASRPIRTGIGHFDAGLLLGKLSESAFFDDDDSNNSRAISAVVAAWRPDVESGLTLGVMRSVYANVSDAADISTHALDALIRWNQLPASNDVSEASSEQITGLFVRWVFPESGLETYAEWARTELPRSLRSLFASPQHSQGYTLGLQWVTPSAENGVVRVQAEASSVESTQKIGGRPTRGFYVSPHVPQGYTHDGQVIGAAIGPGGSSQWLATDYMTEGWSAGLSLNRIRWDEDVYRFVYPYAIPQGRDVSIIAGIRGSYRWNAFEFVGELGSEKRRNYLFQNISTSLDEVEAVDVANRYLKISVGSALPGR